MQHANMERTFRHKLRQSHLGCALKCGQKFVFLGLLLVRSDSSQKQSTRRQEFVALLSR